VLIAAFALQRGAAHPGEAWKLELTAGNVVHHQEGRRAFAGRKATAGQALGEVRDAGCSSSPKSLR
jgi:hypothetical protein